MDINNLSKHQVVLLTLLVCFVTSITTGITVVSLLDQSPQPVVQTINRVIEKTIQQVAPSTVSSSKSSSDSATKETTVVVKEEDLTISAIEKNAQSVVRIRGLVGLNNDAFVSDGVVVSAKGYVLADKLAVSQASNLMGTFSDGSQISLEVINSNDESGLVLLHAKSQPAQQSAFTPVSFADSSILKLGQTMISLSGETKNSVNIGNIASFNTKSDGSVASIVATADITNSLPGGIGLNLSGDIVGMNTGSDKSVFVASNSLKDVAAALLPK